MDAEPLPCTVIFIRLFADADKSAGVAAAPNTAMVGEPAGEDFWRRTDGTKVGWVYVVYHL
jgi:hypothetical protein